MNILVTGCAGFIGSHLTERLLKDGHTVLGIDNFSDFYSRRLKEKNLENFIGDKNFKLVEGDISELKLDAIMKGVSVVFHQAAQAGVRSSWGKNFDIYVTSNILATQKLLEAAKSVKLKKFIYASSSSIYGDAESLPTPEDTKPKPISPYGVSKLAGEHLCYLYNRNFGVPTIILRYFSVYGPRQRPDMAFNKFIRAIMQGDDILVFGSGEQTRDFTYVSDVVDANLLAMKSDISGEIFNIGGGSRISVNETVKTIEKITGKKAKAKYTESQTGDARHTSADIKKARRMLGFKPKIGCEQGLEMEIKWLEPVTE